MPATRGWTRSGSLTLEALAGFYAHAGLRHLLCTAIARDGMLAAPNLGLYAQLLAWAPALALQASGGARDMADMRPADTAGCAGLALRRALLEGRNNTPGTPASRPAAEHPPPPHVPAPS